MKLNWNPPKIENRTAIFYNEVDHAPDVVFGFERLDGTIAPARNYFYYAIAQTNILQTFFENYDGDINAAFDALAEHLHQSMKDAIRSPIWSWDRVTIRQNGAIVKSPRDIYDLGELLRSQKIEITRG